MSTGSMASFWAAFDERDDEEAFFTRVTRAGEVRASLTTAELRFEVLRVANALAEQVDRGAMIVCALPTSIEAVVAMLGAMAAGIPFVPSPALTPRGLQEGTHPAAALLELDVPVLALVSSAHGRLLRRAVKVEGLNILPWDTLTASPARRALPIVPRLTDTAYLQFTSGSTGSPKGVRVTWRALLANLEVMRDATCLDAHSRSLGWAPLFHDLGLISFVMAPFGVGAASWLFAPGEFMADPLLWIRTLSRFGITHTAASDFAFRLCADAQRKDPLPPGAIDLSQLRVVGSGGERVRSSSLDMFFEAFAPFGLRRDAFLPTYGMAESTLVVSASKPAGAPPRRARVGHDALAQGRIVLHDGEDSGERCEDLVSCGRPGLGHDVVAADPETLEVRPPGTLGELFITGPSLGSGYFRRPDATRERFANRLLGREGHWLRSGDMGFLWEGEVFPVGRRDDTILMWGRNVYPDDIEGRVEALGLEGLGPVCAVRAEDSDAVGVDLLVELERPDAGKSALQAWCNELGRELGARSWPIRRVYFLASGGLPRTTSGKVRRGRCVEWIEDGAVPVVAHGERRPDASVVASSVVSERTEEALRSSPSSGAGEVVGLILEEMASMVGVEDPSAFSVHQPVRELGFDSLMVLQLRDRLEAKLSVVLPATLFFERPTVRGIAEWIRDHGTEKTQGAPADAPVRPAPGGDGGPSIAIVGGGAAGLVAALELVDRGYRDITVFEAGEAVGGKVWSVHHDGRAYELGQVWSSEHYATYQSIAKRLGIHVEWFVPPPTNTPSGTVDWEQTHRWATRCLACAGIELGQAAPVDMDEYPAHTFAPLGRWLETQNLGPVPDGIVEWWLGYLYGRLDDDIPACYFLALLHVITNVRAGRVGGGNNHVLEKLAAYLERQGVTVRTGCPVEEVCRDGSGVTVFASGHRHSFDRLVMAVDPARALSILDASEEESRVLGAFRCQDAVVTLLEVEGLPARPVMLFPQAGRAGELLIYTATDAERVITYQLATDDALPGSQALDDDALRKRLDEDLRACGARPGMELARRRWRYFPHLPPAAMRSGVLGELRAMQGRNRTTFVGGFTTMETLEHTMRAAQRAVEASFAPRRASVPRDEPIAVVAMACRFPGGVETPEDLWTLLHRGQDVITDVPATRFDVDAIFDPERGKVGKSHSRWGGFVGDVTRFDAGFFGISPQEARSVDPQERLLLEVSWEAFERAGLTQAELRGSRTGVFVGITANEYRARIMTNLESIDAYSLLGTSFCTMVGRLSYWLDLRGPNLPVDTACSSSLVALHLATRALREGECDLAVAGGVNLLLTPHAFVYFSQVGALSPTGRCRAFGAGADGMVRADGAGVVILKRLADAERDGDDILALVRGTAINHDGRSNGFTAPSGPSQTEVIEAALKNAGVGPAEVSYVECHGTGTPLGDPVEVEALARAYRAEGGEPIAIGSVKSNIGHAEGAAGIAAVIKVILAMQHEELPASLHADPLNPHVAWERLPVEVVREGAKWAVPAGVRRAGVSAFGFSGTNAHVVLEEAPQHDRGRVSSRGAPSSLPILLSATEAPSLRSFAGALSVHLESHRPALVDLAYTLAEARSRFPERAPFVATETDAASGYPKLRAALETFSRDGDASAFTGSSASPEGVVFVFPGQGGQWSAMGRELFEGHVAFREAVEACDAALRPHVGWSVVDVIRGMAGGPPDDRIDVVQPALFTMAVGLAALWRWFGVRPRAVVGHSQGEVVAAHVAGALSLEHAALVIATRSRALLDLVPPGGVAVLGLEPERAKALLAAFGGRLSLAAVNAPDTVVVSGEEGAIDELLARMTREEVFCRRVAADRPFHSEAVEAAREAMLTDLAEVGAQPGAWGCTFYSTSGSPRETPLLDAAYWFANLRDTVRLDRGLAAALDDGHRMFVEVSPHPVLAPVVQPALEARRGRVVGTLRRGAGTPEAFHEALGRAWANGAEVRTSTWFEQSAQRVILPTYSYHRERHWVDVDDTLSAELRTDPKPVTADLHVVQWEKTSGADSVPSMWGFGGRSLSAFIDGPWVETEAEIRERLRDEGPPEQLLVEVPSHDGDADPPGLVEGLVGRTVEVLQSLLGSGLVSCPITWVTRHASLLPSDPLEASLAGAAVWGLVRSARQEYPQQSIRLVDVGGGVDGRLIRRALGSDEVELVVREDGLWCPRLRAAEFPRPTDEVDLARGTAVITGAFGGLGRSLAEHLVVRHGVRRLILVTRGEVDEERAAFVGRLGELGATDSRAVTCDVADRMALERTFAGLKLGEPVTSVFHAAGVLDDTPLELVTPERVAAVLRPKVRGAWNLHELSREWSLEAFVCFSSCVSIFGSATQGPYAAANGFMNALARTRRQRGLAGTSLAWGLWDNDRSSMVQGLDERMLRRLRGMGMHPLPSAAALRILDAIVQQRREPVWVPARLAGGGRGGARRGMALHEVGPETGGDRSLPPPRSPSEIREVVLEECMRVLGISPTHFDPAAPLTAQGMDSLRAMELRGRLEQRLGRRPSVAELLAAPTVEAIADRLACGQRRVAPRTEEEAWLVHETPGSDAALRLFCFPYAGGTPAAFQRWPALLPPSVDLWTVCPPGRAHRIAQPLAFEVDAMAEAIAAEMEPLLDRPFAVFGHCLGAIVAFEVVRRLAELGMRPAHFFASAAGAPEVYFCPPVHASAHFEAVLGRIGFADADVLADAEVREQLLPAVRADFAAASGYVEDGAEPLGVPVTAFAGSDDYFATRHLVERWCDHANGRFTLVDVPGGHYFLTSEVERVVTEVGLACSFAVGEGAQPNVRTRSGGGRRRVVLFGGIEGSSSEEVAREISDGVDVVWWTPPGASGTGAGSSVGTLDAVADQMLRVLADSPDCPTTLVGADLGALVALVVAQRLEMQGAAVDAVSVAGIPPPAVFAMHPCRSGSAEELRQLFELHGFSVSAPTRTLRVWNALFASVHQMAVEPIAADVVISHSPRDPRVHPAAISRWRTQTRGECIHVECSEAPTLVDAWESVAERVTLDAEAPAVLEPSAE